MTRKSSIPLLFKSFRPAAFLHNIRLTASALFLVGGLLASSGAGANQLISEWDPTATILVQVALHHRPDDVTRPTLASDLLDYLQSSSSPPPEEDSEEAGKQAQVEYLAQKWGQSLATVRKYVNLAWAEADKREGLQPELLIAIMQKESSLSTTVQSSYGAQGLMQVVRRWHREKLQPSESLFDPAVNIRVAADILEEYLELAGGSLVAALTKYSGNARNYASTILKETRKLAQVADEAAPEAAYNATR